MKSLTVKNQIEINSTVSKVWEVLTMPKFIRQWDELPEDFNDDLALSKGTEVMWHQPNGQFTKLTVTELVQNKFLKINLYGSKWDMPENAYDIAYNYNLADMGGQTKLEIEIGDFAVLPNGGDYYSASVDFGQTAIKKIKEISEPH